ncbi:hypothetical protein SLEP1_g1638 [Rubroshorea leprosula]|uniref:Formin-like protein n=1 Tax=Rubroshorea leprosula TaxID=152421 RepID=A0AAV5HLJ5_9ROSI|nr:hypothetical protein SLEP1_g1638 [Rubroshorea leprosula]
MALLRKLFYRKPTDGLLEICERVYVFNSCFTTDAWEEENYKVYIRGILSQLQDQFLDALFLVFNFREGDGKSQMASMLSEHDMTIMDYPRQYEGCPLLAMELLHHFLRSCESWLQLGQQNLLLMHCERGGWPVLAFMLAALLIYRKQHSGEQKTLDMIYKQAPRELLHLRSPLNPIPSQLRYLQYVSRRNVTSEWPPFGRALTLDCIILRYIPNFDGEGGCRPIFRICGQDPFLVNDRTARVLYSTPKRSKAAQHYKQIIFSEMDAASSIIAMDFPCFEKKDGLPMEAFAKVHKIFSHVDWSDHRADIARNVLQQIGASNIVHESSDNESISPRMWVASPRKTQEEMNRVLSLSTSPNSSTCWGLQIQLVPSEGPLSPKTDAGTQVGPQDSQFSHQPPSQFNAIHQQKNQCPPVKRSYWQDTFVSIHHSVPLVPIVKPLPYDLVSSEALETENVFVSPPTTPHPPPTLTSSANRALHSPPAPSPGSLLPASQPSYSSSTPKNPATKVEPPALSTYHHTPPPPQTSMLNENQTVSCEPLGASQPSPPMSPLKDPAVRDGCHAASPPAPAPPLKENSAVRAASPPPSPPTPLLKENSAVKAGPPPPPPPPLHHGQSGQAASPKASVSTRPSPPPAAPIMLSNSSQVPSAPPPPVSTGKGFSNTGFAGINGSTAPPAPQLGSSTPQLGSSTSSHKMLSHTISSRSNQTKKLRPLHWLKLTRAVQGSLWAESHKLGGGGGKSTVRGSHGPKSDKVQLIDHRRAYNCEIMLSKVKIPLPELMGLRFWVKTALVIVLVIGKLYSFCAGLSSVLALEESALDVDQVENIIKFCPTKEELELLKGYTGDKEKLGKCEQFFLELMQVPRVESKLRVFSFKIRFCSQVSDLKCSLNVVNSAAEDIRNSVKLKRVMQTILSLVNALNQGTARGSAIGFKLDNLLKLTETHARNKKTTLMNYLCKMLADKIPDLLDFSRDLRNLEPASTVQLKFLAEEMQAISKGLEKVVLELANSETDDPISKKFHKILKEFLCCAEGEVRSLASLYSAVGRNVDAMILYFGEDPARCPFEQVVSTLSNFVRMFNNASEENCKQRVLEMKKLAEAEKAKTNTAQKESEQLLKTPLIQTRQC